MGSLGAIVLWSIIAVKVLSCPDGFVQHQLSCYKFHHVELSWPESLTFCKALNSHLVKIETEKEMDFLKLKANEIAASYPIRNFWVALSDAVNQGEWVWAGTQQRLAFNDWGNTQPDNRSGEDCAGLWNGDHFRLGDWPCRTLLHPICEVELEDGIQAIG